MLVREFPDAGLLLGVLDRLLLTGHVEEDHVRAALDDIRDPEAEGDLTEEDAWIATALQRLGMLEFDPEGLPGIEALDFDGGNDIYMLIEDCLGIHTGGETDHYQVNSLVGLDELDRLQRLDLDGHGYRKAPLDLSPLRDHPALQHVVLSGICSGAGALEHMPALTHLDVTLASLDDESVLERLAARGVRIRDNQN